MSIDAKANRVLARARDLGKKASAWADFSLELFDPHVGLVARTFKTEAERKAFYSSPAYAEINVILVKLMKSTGLAEGAAPTASEKSGRFNVRVPRTLHRSLELEAKREGVSLNQLVVSKLSIPLRHLRQA